MTITYLLENLYNAHWPKDFNAGAFVGPTEDLPPIEANDIKHFPDYVQENIARAIIHENEHIMGTRWYGTYITPLDIYLLNLVKT